MWSSMSVTISSAVAICQREPGMSYVPGLGHSPTHPPTHPLTHSLIHPSVHLPWARESTYLYAAHTSFPVDPCGQMQSLLTHSGLEICSSFFFFFKLRIY